MEYKRQCTYPINDMTPHNCTDIHIGEIFYINKTCKCGCGKPIKIQRHHKWSKILDYIRGSKQ